ncbi:glycoside hydrolase family 32 protein [Halalkalibacter okhensis]|uniref:glycoside hydrolase family 32 protein n=1 Tax=Halalkalibacter okhensis TaxID=333138 RepID=UPI00068C326D|nr:glycoside hydrolase family 32 protein [Halalkalibacter okhensis]
MYSEQFRPQFHFSPKENWMNDPNGLVYYKGEYHLFYQYHPDSTIWGPMHWGHAVSKDLIHWEELPIALYPDELGQIFSGSAVVDKDNTSGLRTSEEEDVIVAIFTHHGEDNEKQSIAYSNDRGRSWTKYKENPVIANPGIKDFRDPKVFWHNETNKWVMSLACGDEIQFYRSPNLIEWEFLSSFGKKYGAHGGVWECPDLIEMEVKGENEKKWVLIVSINPGGPNGGSVVQYFIGDFDGKTFTCDDSNETVRWADPGRDFYAAVSWSNVEKPVWIGWMSNWQYANEVPTSPWRSAMSVPREISLAKMSEGYKLIQKPIKQLEQLRVNEPNKETNVVVNESHSYTLPKVGSLVELDLQVKETKAETWGIRINHGDKNNTDITFHLKESEWGIDRTNSGLVDFSAAFPSEDAASLVADQGVQTVKVYLDTASLEVFLNDGESVMTDIIFPTENDVSIQLFAANGEVVFQKVTVTELKGIW